MTNPPVYITYRERTHVTASGPFVNANREIDRLVLVRNSDNMAIMHDLPQGGETRGQAFPIIPHFDPLSGFGFQYFVNLKQINITVDRVSPVYFSIPGPDPTVDATVFYIPFWKPSYTADSTEQAPHFSIEPIAYPNQAAYPKLVFIDPATQLPSHIEIEVTGASLRVALDYQVIEGQWVITHGKVFSRSGPFSGTSETTYDQFVFSSNAPDPRF